MINLSEEGDDTVLSVGKQASKEVARTKFMGFGDNRINFSFNNTTALCVSKLKFIA